ncbi:MAG: hypothetical protein QOD84_2900 [Acidobacteriaceae bacterium]|jgi:hypothetical protein
MPETIREPWASFLRALDELATEPVEFHCIGGFAVTEKYGFERDTLDLDVLTIVPNTQKQEFLEKGAQGSALARKHNVYLDLVTIIESYPDDYESRLTELHPGELNHIRLMVPEAHDLALMKLGRNIERDREDVKFLARRGHITQGGLTSRYEKEMRPYIALPEQRTDPVLRLWLEMIGEDLEATKASHT